MSNAMALLDCKPGVRSNLRHWQPAAQRTNPLLGQEVSLVAGCRNSVVSPLRHWIGASRRAPLLSAGFECGANGAWKRHSGGAKKVGARGARLDLDCFSKSGGTVEKVASSCGRPHSKGKPFQLSRNKTRAEVLNASTGGQSGVEFASQSVGPQAASTESEYEEAEYAVGRTGGAEESQPVASTSGRGETILPSGAESKSGRRARGNASRQFRYDGGERTRARWDLNMIETESPEAKEQKRARAEVLGGSEENGRQKPALGARFDTETNGGTHLGAVSGNGVGTEGSEAREGGPKEAQMHTDESADANLEERRTRRGGLLERGGNADFAPSLQSLLLTLKSANNSPPPPSASASFPGQKDDPREWRRPLPPSDAPETAPPKRNRRRSKARQLEPHLVTQVVEELKREPQWGNIAGILDKWEGRTSLRNYELLMKELCWQGDYLRSVKAFAWMKEQRKWYRPRVEIYNHLLQMLSRYGKLDFIRGLFKEMDLYSVMPNSESWQALISAHGKAGSTEGAVWAFEEMQRRGVPANNWSYNCLLSAFAHGREWQRALEYLDKMQADGISPDRVTFNTVLSACRNGGQFERAIDIFESLPKLGICPNRVTCNTMITVYSRIGHFEKVTALFEEMLSAPGGSQQRPDLLTYNSVLQAYSMSGDIERAGALFDRMLQQGPRPSLVTWNTLMSAYAKLGRHEEARALLLRLRQYGKRPDVVSYSTLLSAYAKAGLAKEARGVFEEMTNEGVKPNAVTYNAVMDAYAKSNDHAAALTWLEKMRADGVTPNVVTYTTLINACGRAGRIEEAARVLDEAGESSVNVVTFNAMIHSCGANDAFDAAIRVFEAMRVSGLQPNIATYNGVLDSFGRAGKLDEMEQAFQQMLREGLVPTVETFTIMIDLYGKKGLPEEAWRTYEAMKAAGCPPNIVTMTSLINACAKGNMYYEGLLAWQELLAMGLEPDVVTYGALIEMCNKNGNFDVALEFGEKMRDSARRAGGLKPNLVIYNQLLAAAGRQRDFDLCVELFQELQDNGHAPNNWTFHALMDAFGSAGRPDKVERIFREMHNVFGVDANLVSYNLLVGAYARVINSRALDIFEEMKEKGIAPSVMTYNWVLMYMRKAGTGPQKAIRLFSEMVAGGVAPTAISYVEMVRILQRAGMDEEAAAMQKELELVQGDDAIMRVAELTSERQVSSRGNAEVDSRGSSDLETDNPEELLENKAGLSDGLEGEAGWRHLLVATERGVD